MDERRKEAEHLSGRFLCGEKSALKPTKHVLVSGITESREYTREEMLQTQRCHSMHMEGLRRPNTSMGTHCLLCTSTSPSSTRRPKSSRLAACVRAGQADPGGYQGPPEGNPALHGLLGASKLTLDQRKLWSLREAEEEQDGS